MTAVTIQIPTVGQPWPEQGGFYIGPRLIDGQVHHIIIPGGAEHDTKDVQFNDIEEAIKAAGEINGFSDWYLPARDELELAYRALKPTADHNWTYRHGENPSSVPPSYPYTATAPAQTTVESFAAGSEDAFDPSWYWSSTQFSAHDAWGQTFGGGGQDYGGKDVQRRARAVRRFLIP